MPPCPGDLFWPAAAPAQWRARWIAPAGVEAVNSAYFYARKLFTVETVPSRELLHIAAETLYLLYINGVAVGRGPVRGTHTVNFFDTYDIASHLKQGDNWIAIAIHCPNVASFKHSPVRPGVFAQFDDGRIATDVDWEVKTSPAHFAGAPNYTYQIGRMEWKDLRSEPLGWQTGRDDGEWQTPLIVCDDERIGDKDLRARDIPALHEDRYQPVSVPLIAMTPPLDDLADTRVAERMTFEAHRRLKKPIDTASLLQDDGAPITIDAGAKGEGVTLIFNFGREINGGFELELDAPAGTVVDIGYQEELCNGRLNLFYEDYTFADRYILRKGLQVIGSEFTERGYRMAQIVLRNFDRPIQLHRVTAINRLYPYIARGSFECSDPMLNQLWHTCGETLRACTTDTFVDCPWRENALYLNDMIVEDVTSMQMFGDPRIVERCIRLAASQVREDGLFPGAVPYGKCPGKTLDASCDRMTLTAGNLTFPQVLEEYLLYSGDKATTLEFAKQMPTMLAQFAKWEDASGFCRPPIEIWNFIDWSYPVEIENQTTCAIEWLRVIALDTTARLIKRLAPQRNTRMLSNKAERLAAAIEEHFWDERQQCYREGVDTDDGQPLLTQLTQACAILSGRLTSDRKRILGKALLREDLLTPELFMQHFVLRAMIATHQPIAARQRIEQYWSPMIKSGSPTIWELGVHTIGKAGFDGAGSLCHGFSTTPIDFMQCVVLGIRPVAAGFSRCVFRPHDIGLDDAAGDIPTPAGNLNVKWKRSVRGLNATLSVPPGITVALPNSQTIGEGTHAITIPQPATNTPTIKPVVIDVTN